MSAESIVIVDAIRTPIGELLGQFSQTPAPRLAATCIQSLLERTQCPVDAIEASLFGCVLTAGLGQAPARQAALLGGLNQATHSITINKMCGSGLSAIIIGHDAMRAGTYDCLIAGGMENMSLSPHLLPRSRAGFKMGHQVLQDHMLLDGLEDAYQRSTLMGVYAEQCAQHYNFTREVQDAFALLSLKKATSAALNVFSSEITPVKITLKDKDLAITLDELPRNARPEKIPALKPAFSAQGTVTAANSSGISDGAAALLLMTQSKADTLGLRPRARIIGHSTYAGAPEWFTTAPGHAIKSLLKKCHWDIKNVDLFEINEAFAVVTLAAIKDCNIDPSRVNIYGGACALGHPIGASGARILCTLINALEQTKGRRGIAALCIGGGEACAIAVELY